MCKPPLFLGFLHYYLYSALPNFRFLNLTRNCEIFCIRISNEEYFCFCIIERSFVEVYNDIISFDERHSILATSGERILNTE